MQWWVILIIVVCLLLLLCFLLSVANFSGERFMERYKEMDKKFSLKGFTSMEFIGLINKKYFSGGLQIVQISRLAGDCYSKGKLFLSTETIKQSSLASYTIIAHEMGHALQDKEGKKLKRLRALRKTGKLLGLFMLPSVIAGVILMLFGSTFLYWGISLIAVGGLIFFLALLIKLLTISLEKDASKKAIIFLREILNEKEIKECKKFLNDAKLTYWAEFLRLCLGWTSMSRKAKLFN